MRGHLPLVRVCLYLLCVSGTAGQCPSLLPTVEEYWLLHQCLLERVSAGETLVTRDAARRYIDQLEAAGDAVTFPPAEKQYKVTNAYGNLP